MTPDDGHGPDADDPDAAYQTPVTPESQASSVDLRLFERLVRAMPAGAGELTRVGPPELVDDLLERLAALGLLDVAPDGAVVVLDPRRQRSSAVQPARTAERDALAQMSVIYAKHQDPGPRTPLPT